MRSGRHPRFLETRERSKHGLVLHPWVHHDQNNMTGEAVRPFILASEWLARVYLRRAGYRRASLCALLAHTTGPGLWGEDEDIFPRDSAGGGRSCPPSRWRRLGV